VPWQSLQLGANGSFCAAFFRGRWRHTGSVLRYDTGRSRREPASPDCGTSLMSLWQATQSRAAWGDAF